MSKTNHTMSADHLDASLPWYAAGTLDAREAAQVEAALAADGDPPSVLIWCARR